jgi:cytochrome P450
MSAALPPGPPGLPLLGNLLAFRAFPPGFLARSAAAYDSEVIHYRLARTDVFFMKHPDLIREVLVTRQHDFGLGRGLQWVKLFLGEGLLTSEGEFHTRQRRLSQPAFHRQRITGYGRIMTDYAARARDTWSDGQVLQFDREIMSVTLAIVGKALFDAEVGGEADEIAESLGTVLGLFPRFALPFRGVLQKLPLPSNRRFTRAVARLDATVYRMIAERRRDPRDRGDLLSMLLLAQDVEGDGGSMTDRHLRDEVMTLLLAGHETTSNALTWTFYLLSQNPEHAARLHQELDTVLQGRLPTVEDLPSLPFAERVLSESMRLFPPAWGMGRRVLRDVEMGGFHIPAEALVSVSPFVTHRDPRWWPDPERFDPDRFAPEAKAARPRFAYFPFGGGARQCIGEPFAWMEGVLVLATLAQKWRFDLAPGHRVEPQALVTLRPRYGMRLVARRRG